MELLEIPQLIEACVKKGSYDEAVDLLAKSSTIARVHRHLKGIDLMVSFTLLLRRQFDTLIAELYAGGGRTARALCSCCAAARDDIGRRTAAAVSLLCLVLATSGRIL